MNLLRLILIVSLFPASIFPWSWFSNPTVAEKVDFDCPHRCGKWGSESIQALEWQFVLCLYEADKLQKFIQKNELEYFDDPKHYSLVEPQLMPHPENFQSEWYQEMLTTYQYGRLVIRNEYHCGEGWGIFWKIKHINQVDGKHLGKVFKRNKHNRCWFNGIEVDDNYEEGEEEALEEEHKDDPDWNNCIWYNPVEKNKYSFKNRIDFHNACLQVEHDLLDEVQDKSFRGVDDIPFFKKEMYDQFAKFSFKLQEVRNSYDYIFEECSHLHHAPSAEYELIQRQFENGDYSEAIEALKVLLSRVNLDDLESHLASNIYTSKGWAENETLQYDEAIISLSQAITLKPTNPDAYFERAIAYFEVGQFDLSLQDYLSQGKDITFKSYKIDWDLSGFSVGFLEGGMNGIRDASAEFLPSIYNSVSGVGNFLWLTIQHPIDAPTKLIESTWEFCNHLRACDKAELAKMLVPEMYELIDKWDQLTFERRGELLGYSLGKYGLDILLPIATVKGLKYVKTFHEIKRAEKLCTLQTLAKSPQSKEALTQAAAQWRNQREISFANVKLLKDHQSKHVVGSRNYQLGKGRWEHLDPQGLLNKHAGKGQKVCGKKGQPGYRERVDFGEFIGYYENDKITKPLPTTVGIIHYNKRGAHIVPARPKK